MQTKQSKRIRIFMASIALTVMAVSVPFAYVYFKPHKGVDGKAADFQYNVKQLVDFYVVDETSADSLFLDKIIEVTGKIREINPTGDGGFTLVLGDPEEMGGVSAELLADQTQKAKKLKEGDKITIKGFCSGYLLDVVLVKSIIVQ